MLRRVTDPHEVLNAVFGAFLVDGRRPAIVKSRWAAVSSQLKVVRVAIVAVRSVVMVVDVLRSLVAARCVIVREFWNIPLLLMIPFLYAWRHRILWNVNHNLRSPSGGFPPSLSLAARLGFRFLLLDGARAVAAFPPHVQGAFLAPLFPMIDRSGPRGVRDAVRIVLVGDMRPEKASHQELEQVLERLTLIDGATVQLGVRGGASTGLVLPRGAMVVNTETREQFLCLLLESDIVVLLAQRDAYFNRNSGTVVDAISCGAWPVVPAFPVLQVQVGEPAQVGSTYESISDIVSVVKNAILQLTIRRGSRDAYFAGRGPASVTTHD